MGIKAVACDEGAVLITTDPGWAFGPIFDSVDEAKDFLRWLRVDPRKLTDSELERRYYDWLDGERADRVSRAVDAVCDRKREY